MGSIANTAIIDQADLVESKNMLNWLVRVGLDVSGQVQDVRGNDEGKYTKARLRRTFDTRG